MPKGWLPIESRAMDGIAYWLSLGMEEFHGLEEKSVFDRESASQLIGYLYRVGWNSSSPLHDLAFHLMLA